MTPKRLLRLASTAEAITWALLLAGMWLKYGPAQNGLGVAIAGSLHGAAFYGLPPAEDRITLARREEPFAPPAQIAAGGDSVTTFDPGFPIHWHPEAR